MARHTDDRIPVTVVTGVLGAGKTTLVNRVLRNQRGYEVAVVVNDMGEVNVDAELVAGETDGDVVDLSNGCICCRLRDDLVTEVRRLAETREFDYLLVEASGISDPVPVARTFLGEDEGDDDPTDYYRLDTMVSVVDAYGFWKAFDPETDPPEGRQSGRPLSEVFVEQVEYCDVLLLNKTDLVPEEDLDAVESLVRELQPRAVHYRTEHADVDPGAVLGTGLFDAEEIRRSAGWKRRLAGDHGEEGHDHGTHESAAEAHGVTSFLYERTRPFHPERLDAWLDEWPVGVVRAKGFFRLAGRPETVMGLNRAGPSVQAGPIGEWGPDDDPTTRLVFIGTDVDEDAIRTALDDCLADDDELAAADLSDPFPTA
jgi:G3E family GTPase